MRRGLFNAKMLAVKITQKMQKKYEELFLKDKAFEN